MKKQIIISSFIVIGSQGHAMLTTLPSKALCAKTKTSCAPFHFSLKNTDENKKKMHGYYGDEDLHQLITENICNNLSTQEWNYKIREHCWQVRESDKVYLQLQEIIRHEDAQKIIPTATQKTVLFHKLQSIAYGSSAATITVTLPTITTYYSYDIAYSALLWSTGLIVALTLAHSTHYHYKLSNTAALNAKNNVHLLHQIIKNEK